MKALRRAIWRSRMRSNLGVPVHLAVSVAAAALSVATLLGAPQESSPPPPSKPEHFTALAVPSGAGGTPIVIDLYVERWSTPAENDRFMAAVTEVGTKGVVDVLRKLPKVGSFAVIGNSGYPITYAWRFVGEDGIEHITLATERYVSFWETTEQSRSLDYPITLIELRMKPGSNSGEGQVDVAAKIDRDKISKTVIIENMGIQPVMLTTVKRVR
jgi:hypothetical protein